MHITAVSGLRAIGLDVKAVARKRGADLPHHPLLPPPVLQLTRHWLKLGGKTPPAWSQFEMMDVSDVVPYLTVLRCNPDNTFTFIFTGSAVSTILSEDLTGHTVSAAEAVWGGNRLVSPLQAGGRCGRHPSPRRRDQSGAHVTDRIYRRRFSVHGRCRRRRQICRGRDRRASELRRLRPGC